LGFRVYGLGFRVKDTGIRIGVIYLFRVWGPGGFRFRVE
jgi:hypothetical protein